MLLVLLAVLHPTLRMMLRIFCVVVTGGVNITNHKTASKGGSGISFIVRTISMELEQYTESGLDGSFHYAFNVGSAVRVKDAPEVKP
jgi:hypothetical protein